MSIFYCLYYAFNTVEQTLEYSEISLAQFPDREKRQRDIADLFRMQGVSPQAAEELVEKHHDLKWHGEINNNGRVITLHSLPDGASLPASVVQDTTSGRYYPASYVQYQEGCFDYVHDEADNLLTIQNKENPTLLDYAHAINTAIQKIWGAYQVSGDTRRKYFGEQTIMSIEDIIAHKMQVCVEKSVAVFSYLESKGFNNLTLNFHAEREGSVSEGHCFVQAKDQGELYTIHGGSRVEGASKEKLEVNRSDRMA